MQTNQFNFYDVANPKKGKIGAPDITLTPSTCFTIADYKITFKHKPSDDISKFLKVMSDKSGLEIETNDRIYVGFHEFTIEAVVSNDETV